MKRVRNTILLAVAAALSLTAVPVLAQDNPASASEETQPARARNIILFLADAGGVPTISAASLLGYG